MIAAELTLYDFPDAPSAKRARMFIAEKNIAVERIIIDLRSGAHLRPDYLAVNPQGLVPALRMPDGIILTENDGIAAYLESIAPDPALLGSTPLERGRVLQWNARIELEGLLPTADVVRNGYPAFRDRALPGVHPYAQIPALAERGRARVQYFLPALEAQLECGGFVAGGRFSLADITGIVFLDLTSRIGMTLDGYPALAAWAERIRSRPSYSA